MFDPKKISKAEFGGGKQTWKVFGLPLVAHERRRAGLFAGYHAGEEREEDGGRASRR